MRITIYIIITFFFHLNLFGQNNFVPGEITLSKGDSKKGYIDFRDWKVNPELIQFKNDLNGSSVTYKPEELETFKVNGYTYVSTRTTIPTLQSFKEEFKSDHQTEVKSVFLRVIIRDSKELYEYSYSNGKNVYLIGSNKNFELLVYKKYFRKINGEIIATENNKYLGQLILYLNDCDDVNTQLKRSSYGSKSLIKLFESYYDCKGEKFKIESPISKPKNRFGIQTGATLTKIISDKSEGNQEFDNSTDFTVGLYYEYVIPKNRGQWSIMNEVTFSRYETFNYYESSNTNFDFNFSRSIGFSLININHMIRKSIPIGKLSIFLNGGISNSWNIHEITNSTTRESIFKLNDISTITESPTFNELKKYQFGVILGVGVKKEKISIDIRHVINADRSKNSSTSFRTNVMAVILAYRIN